MAKLTFVLEDGQEVVVPLTERMIIGRAEESDVVVDDERISQQHAELLQNADGSIQVFDLNSASGTFVNGTPQKSCTLLHGDQLAFGPLIARLDLEDMEETPVTPAKPPEDERALATEVARLGAEKARLQAAVDAAADELRDWEKRAEKERAMHLARAESLRAEVEQLVPLQAAVRDAENAHREWMESISAITAQQQEKAAALEDLTTRCAAKSAELERLSAAAATATREVEALTSRIKQLCDECEQDEAVLNSLRQQIITLEQNVKEEEARQSSLAASGTELARKRLNDETAVKDLESLLMKLEQQGAKAQGTLQRKQEELAGCEAKLAAQKSACEAENRLLQDATARRAEIESKCQQLAGVEADLLHKQKELAACEKKLAGQKEALEAENRRLDEATARRAGIERQCVELADVKQQLADARQRLEAVDKRLQATNTEPPHQLAVHKRKAASSEDSEAKLQELLRQIETARQELGDLQGKITKLRDAPASQAQIPAAGGQAAEHAHQETVISAPLIVHVDAVRLAPVAMKSERAKAAAAASTKVKPKKA